MNTAAVPLAILSALVLVGALWVVTLHNLFRAALSLGLVFLGIAGLFICLGAEFLALVQLLIYVGAILVLIIFAIMLTNSWQRETLPASRQRLPAALAALALFALLARATWVLAWPAQIPGGATRLKDLGLVLVKTLVLPFEVISLIFVVVVVGAIAVAAPRKGQS
jgi:NADH:ubiquinone oxidoreductase subunit 6 (subunit J)